jgi:hypothetical protein
MENDQKSNKAGGRRKRPIQNSLETRINLQEVFKITSKGVVVGDEKLTDIEIQSLKSEVEVFKALRLWRIINETIKQEAVNKAINESTNWEEVLSGKMMLFNLQLINNILTFIKNLKE